MTLPKMYPADKLVFKKPKHKNLYQKIYPKVKNLIFKVEKYRCYPHNDDFIDFRQWVLQDLIKLDNEIRKHDECRGGCIVCDTARGIKIK